MKTLGLRRAALGGALVGALSGCSAEVPASVTPELFQLSDMEVLTYDAQSAHVLLKGEVHLDDVKPLTLIQFFSHPKCSDGLLGDGAYSTFQTDGLELLLPSDGDTEIYVTTNTSDRCYPFFTFSPEHLAPGAPTLTSTVPASPSRESTTPTVFGTAPAPADRVRFYSDSACTVEIGAGTAADYATVGIPLTVAANVKTVLYAQAVEPFDHASDCEKVGQYVNDSTSPTPAVFASLIPASPSNSSTTPKVLGSLESGASLVKIFADPACANELGSGTKSEFAAGITVEVPPNETTTLWAIAFDAAGNPSSCAFLRDYVHDTLPPSAPAYTTITPASPSRATFIPKVKGTASADTASVRFYGDPMCLTLIGAGTKASFTGAGINVTVPMNQTTTIYAKDVDAAGNASSCTYLTDFTHDTIPPNQPVFTLTDPASPNNDSITPIVVGNTPLDAVTVRLFDDATCTTLIGSGSAEDYVTDGLPVTVLANHITLIHGTTLDEVGNESECGFLVNYAHSDLAPDSPVFVSTSPHSPSRTVTNPYVNGTAVPIISQVRLYADDHCVAQIGGGSRVAFAGAGLQITGQANFHNEIYVQATDIYGNESDCDLLTTYTHVDIAPSNPVFSAYDPASPNNQSASPLISGTAPDNVLSLLPTDAVGFYDSEICSNQIGLGPVADFRGAGIMINPAANAITAVYAKTFDAAGNASGCVLMQNYTHNTIPPGRPNFVSATPDSPSYTRVTAIRGTISTSLSPMPVDEVRFFSDASCASALETGAPAQFTSGGIPVTALANATTTLYARTADEVGNLSTCRPMINFLHSNLGPTSLTATPQSNGSVSLTWNPDTVASPSPKYTVKRAVRSGGPYTIIASDLTGTYLQDYNVKNAQTFYYVVSATNITGTSLDSAEVSATISASLPSTPLSLTASPGFSRVQLAWTGNSSALHFDIYRSLQASGPYDRIRAAYPAQSYIDTDVTNGTAYFYVVRAANPAGFSVSSNEASAVPLGSPAAPIQLQVAGTTWTSACNGRGVILSWSAPPHYTNFVVKSGSSPGLGTTLGNTGATSYVDCSTNSMATRYYSVSAQWDVQEGANSNELIFEATTPPTLTANAGDSQVVLTWVTTGSPSSTRVMRATSLTGTYTEIASVTSGSSYTDSTAANGTAYFYRLRSLYSTDTVEGWDSNTVDAVPSTAPAAPANLRYAVSANVPVLSWSGLSRFNRYVIYRSATVAGTYTSIGTTTTETLTDASPLTGMNFYRVTAIWGTTETAPSGVVAFRHGIPTAVTATPGTGKITIAWGGVTGASNYSIRRSLTPGGPYTQVGTAAATPYNDTTTVNGTGYYYVVVAQFADATAGQPSVEVSGTVASSVPGGLMVTSTTSTSITLAWAKTTNAIRYNLYSSSASSGPWTARGTATTLSATITSLTANTQYYVTVTSTIGSTESAKPTAIAARTLNGPSTPTVVAANGSVSITWSPATAPLSYTVLRTSDGTNYAAVPGGSGLTGTTHTDSSVSNGTLYQYVIQANYSSSTLKSSPSSPVTPGVMPVTPTGLVAHGNGSGTDIYLSWAGVTAATGYKIYSSTTNGGPYTLATSTSTPQYNLISSLTTGTTYYFVVSALNGDTETAKSAQVAAIPAVTPAAPTVAVNAAGDIVVTWSAVSGAATYQVQRSGDGVNYQTVATGLGATTFTDTTNVDDISYLYRYLPKSAASIDLAVSLSSSSVTSGLKPTTPLDLVATAANTSAINLLWTPAPNVVSYRVYRGTASGGPYTALATLSVPTNTYSDAAVSSGNAYFYVVKSINASGVESDPSEEASVRLVASPAALVANAASGQVALTWSAVATAASYLVRRSTETGGPYATIASGIATQAYNDTDVENGKTYYYVVNAVFASGAHSQNSNEASAVASNTMNLQVPIEMIDRGLASNTAPVVFERSRTSLDPSAYDGTVSYALEIVALNQDSVDRAVTLYDAANANKGSITVPASTTSAKRLRAAITPNGAWDTYRLGLAATASAMQLQVLSARLLITQTGASRTRIYLPLLASSAGPSANDLTAPVVTTSNVNHAPAADSSIVVRDTSAYAQIAEYLPWELESLVSASAGTIGTVALYNSTSSTAVTDTEAVFGESVVTLVSSPFEDGVTGFALADEGDAFQVSLRCLLECTGSVKLYKAGLWLNLESLSRAEILYRIGIGTLLTAGNTVFTNGRVLYDATAFSHPVVHFQAVAIGPSSGSTDVALDDVAANDSGTGSATTVPSSTVTFSSNAKVRQRSGVITPTSGRRHITEATDATGGTRIIDSALIVETSR